MKHTRLASARLDAFFSRGRFATDLRARTFRNTFSYNRDRILFRNVPSTSHRGVSAARAAFNRARHVRSTSLRRYTQCTHNRHACTRAKYLCRPRDARVTVVLIELLFQLMSTFIIRARARGVGAGRETHPSRPGSRGSLTKARGIHLRVV